VGFFKKILLAALDLNCLCTVLVSFTVMYSYLLNTFLVKVICSP